MVDDAPLAVAADIVRSCQPDVVFFSSLESWTPSQIHYIKAAAGPNLRGVVGMAGVDISHLDSLREVDVFLTCMKGFARTLRSQGLDARFVPHAFDKRVLTRLHFSPASPCEFVFVGNVVSGPHYHDEREVVLRRLIDEAGMFIHSDINAPKSGETMRFVKQTLAYWGGKALRPVPVVYDHLPYGNALRHAGMWPGSPRRQRSSWPKDRVHPSVYGLDMYNALSGALLTANVHIGGAGPYAANMRLFEATGAGVCLLTDAKSDLGEFFEDGTEVVSFSSPEEAIEKANYLIDHPEAALEIGRAGQARTLNGHTYEHGASLVADAMHSAASRGSRDGVQA